METAKLENIVANVVDYVKAERLNYLNRFGSSPRFGAFKFLAWDEFGLWGYSQEEQDYIEGQASEKLS